MVEPRGASAAAAATVSAQQSVSTIDFAYSSTATIGPLSALVWSCNRILCASPYP